MVCVPGPSSGLENSSIAEHHREIDNPVFHGAVPNSVCATFKSVSSINSQRLHFKTYLQFVPTMPPICACKRVSRLHGSGKASAPAHRRTRVDGEEEITIFDLGVQINPRQRRLNFYVHTGGIRFCDREEELSMFKHTPLGGTSRSCSC